MFITYVMGFTTNLYKILLFKVCAYIHPKESSSLSNGPYNNLCNILLHPFKGVLNYYLISYLSNGPYSYNLQFTTNLYNFLLVN